jgi:hypothetical protein
MNLTHIYAQEGQHDKAVIVANDDALQALIHAIGMARYTVDHHGQCDAMTADGEHYRVVVVLKNDDWQAAAWQSLRLPYTHESALDRREDAIDPSELRRRAQTLSAAQLQTKLAHLLRAAESALRALDDASSMVDPGEDGQIAYERELADLRAAIRAAGGPA